MSTILFMTTHTTELTLKQRPWWYFQEAVRDDQAAQLYKKTLSVTLVKSSSETPLLGTAQGL